MLTSFSAGNAYAFVEAVPILLGNKKVNKKATKKVSCHACVKAWDWAQVGERFNCLAFTLEVSVVHFLCSFAKCHAMQSDYVI